MARKTTSLPFAARLRSLREAAGITKYRLAQLSGITQQQIGRLESGTREPSLETARRLAQALGRKLDAWD